MTVEDIIETTVNELEKLVRTETVVGDPMEVGDTKIVPIIKVSFGFGAGSGEDKGKKEGSAGGAGAGSNIEPVAFIVSNEKETKILSIKDKGRSIEKLVEEAPEILEKLKDIDLTKFKPKKKQEPEEEVEETE